MTIFRTLIVRAAASTLLLLVPYSFPQSLPAACAQTMTDHVVAGELVVTDVANNRFRIVGHGGSFSAPAGASVEAFDGKPVRVELTGAGRVLRISEAPVHYEPITHAFETISGQLLVTEAAPRTFTIAGDSRVYVAPTGIDIGLFAGRMVEVRLDEQGRVSNIDLTARSDGTTELPAPRACMIGGATVASGSSVCRSGTTFRCRDGEWMNVGTACS